MVFESNLVTCPKCDNTFEHNRVNGLAIIEAVNRIDARKRMYCKLALDLIEGQFTADLVNFQRIKKILLDNFNDYNRDVQTILGMGEDLE